LNRWNTQQLGYVFAVLQPNIDDDRHNENIWFVSPQIANEMHDLVPKVEKTFETAITKSKANAQLSLQAEIIRLKAQLAEQQRQNAELQMKINNTPSQVSTESPISADEFGDIEQDEDEEFDIFD
jgi:hypothetical protein